MVPSEYQHHLIRDFLTIAFRIYLFTTFTTIPITQSVEEFFTRFRFLTFEAHLLYSIRALQGGVRGGGTRNFDSLILQTGKFNFSAFNAIAEPLSQEGKNISQKIFGAKPTLKIVKMVKP
jgi:hypothetical protein